MFCAPSSDSFLLGSFFLDVKPNFSIPQRANQANSSVAANGNVWSDCPVPLLRSWSGARTSCAGYPLKREPGPWLLRVCSGTIFCELSTISERGANTSTIHEPRFILPIDLDAYYASIEQRDRPNLRDKLVIVLGIVSL